MHQIYTNCWFTRKDFVILFYILYLPFVVRGNESKILTSPAAVA